MAGAVTSIVGPGHRHRCNSHAKIDCPSTRNIAFGIPIRLPAPPAINASVVDERISTSNAVPKGVSSSPCP